MFLETGPPSFTQFPEVEHWCQTLPSGPSLPLTPPDTASDCTGSDCQDMNCLPWSQATQAEEFWYSEFAQDHSTEANSLPIEWTQVSSVSDFQPQQASDFAFVANGPVDTGSTPALSYESQSLRTHNHASEIDTSFQGSAVAYSVPSATYWNTNAERPAGRTSYGPKQPLVGNDVLFPAMFASGAMPTQVTFSHGSQGLTTPVMMMPTVVAPSRTISQQPLAVGRPLLPRTKATSTPDAVQGMVSSAVHIPLLRRSLVNSPENMDFPTLARTNTPQVSQSGSSPVHATLAATTDDFYRSLPAASAVPNTHVRSSGATQALADPTADDFSAFIDVSYEDQTFANSLAKLEPAITSVLTTTSESWQGYRSPLSESRSRMESGLSSQGIQNDPHMENKSRRSSNLTVAALTELDEGRHRNHPLYSRGPDPDGMYRCPWKAVENCLHEPNKLKCNYE